MDGTTAGMAGAKQEVVFSEAQQEWRRRREEEDREQKEFFEQLNDFPNLFSEKHHLHDDHQTRALLERQQTEMEDGGFQYELETTRCHNLIIFLQYILGRKQEAKEYAARIQPEMKDSVIFLTTLAVMQWEFSLKSDCSQTIAALRRMANTGEYEYHLAVARSEIGHFYICVGPRGFLPAIDLFQDVIDKCKDYPYDDYLWKFDLALAIRRNFSMFAYSEHRELSSSFLARKAFDLLTNVAEDCPMMAYKARAKVELARLILNLNAFAKCCKEEDKAYIQELRKSGNPQALLGDALRMSGEDHFVLRECGRQFLIDRDIEQAIEYLRKSYEKRKNSIICQLLGKAMIRKYLYGAGTPRAGRAKPDAATRTSGPSRHTPSPRGGRGVGPGRSAPISPTSSQPAITQTPNEDVLQRLLKIKRQDIYYDPTNSHVQDAEKFYLEGLEGNPRNHGLVYDIGIFYEGMRRPEEALKYYERIIGEKELASPLHVVNAYMRGGLCLLELSEQRQGSPEGARMVKQAEDMFMASLVQCRQAVAHLPQVSDKRATLWESYSKLLSILQLSENNTSRYKEAQVHELVGNYLQAIELYEEALNLAITEQGRTKALHGTIADYLSMGNLKEAKFILDLFLTSDQREFILTDDDNNTAELREVAIRVYRAAAQGALGAGNTADAHSAFRMALVLKRILPDKADQQSEATGGAPSTMSSEQLASDNLESFEGCIFYDDESPTDELLQTLSADVASLMRRSFGLRVSVNDEGVTLGRLTFTSELLLAESAPLVVLIISPGSELSPRMAFIADKVLTSHANTAQRSHADTAQRSHADRDQGSHADRAHGSHADRAHGSHADRDQGSQANTAHGSHADRAHGSHADRDQGSQANTAHGSHADRAHGTHADRAQGTHADRAHGSHADRAHGSRNQRRILTILANGSRSDLPSPLACFQPYSKTQELLSMGASDAGSDVSTACHLFDAFLEGN